MSSTHTEFGVRLALGATPASLAGLILTHTIKLTIVSLLLGTLGAAQLAGILRAFLVGVSATDWATYAAAASLLFVVSMLAAYLPTRRIAATDPLLALRRS